jgi:triosephosphate isomerase
MNRQPVVTLGVSLKMYFSYQRTLGWCQAIAAQLGANAWVSSGHIEVFVIPSFPMLPAALGILAGHAQVGAQNLCWDDEGAYTGEVSPAVLREIGCRLVEIGHAERRRYFAETDQQIADKTAAAWRNGLTPLLCLGEPQRGPVDDAVALCLEQLDSALAVARRTSLSGELILAYEPQWAIGATQPATPAYIGQVCQALAEAVASAGLSARVIYGGSAGPGLLGSLGQQVDGVFLGRFAHDPEAFARILGEAGHLCLGAEAGQQEGGQWQSA